MSKLKNQIGNMGEEKNCTRGPQLNKGIFFLVGFRFRQNRTLKNRRNWVEGREVVRKKTKHIVEIRETDPEEVWRRRNKF